MPSYMSYLRQMAVLDADDDIQWITVKGNHIPIKKGESKEDAVKAFFESKSKSAGGKSESKNDDYPDKEYHELRRNLKSAFEDFPKFEIRDNFAVSENDKKRVIVEKYDEEEYPFEVTTETAGGELIEHEYFKSANSAAKYAEKQRVKHNINVGESETKEEKSDSGKKPFMTEEEYASVKKNVEHILKKAVDSEPKITKDLKSIEGIKLLGLDYRLKTEKSAVEKVKRERIEKGEKIAKYTDEDIMSGMWDLVRYTQEVDKDTFVEQAEKTLKTLEKKGYKVFELKNFWLPEYNNNGSNPYRGVNVKLLSPDGQKVELQFNTANNMKVKEDMHQIYNQQREYKPDSKEFKELNEKSLKLTKLFDNPKGIERLVRKKATN